MLEPGWLYCVYLVDFGQVSTQAQASGCILLPLRFV